MFAKRFIVYVDKRVNMNGNRLPMWAIYRIAESHLKSAYISNYKINFN